MTITTELEKLAVLKEKGLLNDTEFEQQKQIILEQSGENPTEKKGFWEWYLTSWKKWCTFSGRANRTEFFAFILGNSLIGTVLGFYFGASNTGQIISLVFSLVTFLPYLAVYTRRFHDMDRSARFAFIPYLSLLCLILITIMQAIGDYNTPVPTESLVFSLIMLTGILIMFVLFITWTVFLFLKGTTGTNKYGAQPPQPQKYLSTIFAILTVLFFLLMGLSVADGIANYRSTLKAYETNQTQQTQQMQELQQLQNSVVSEKQIEGNSLYFI